MSRYIVGVIVAFGLNAFVPNIAQALQGQTNSFITEQIEQQQALARASAEGEQWFKRMQEALNSLNYRASFIAMQPSGLQAYRWLHSVTPAGNHIEVIEGLNGPHNQAIRINSQVTYLSSVSDAYSVLSNTLSSPILSGLYGEYSAISHAYNVVAVGGDRVVDRDAQHLRIIPHARDRYLYSVWVDRETGLLLGVNTYLPSGDIVEQVLLTSIHVQAEPLTELEQLEQQWDNLPTNQGPVATPATATKWQFGWLPPGFRLERQQRVRVAMNGPVAEHFMFSDGMAKFSVYISEGNDQVVPVQYENLMSMVSVKHNNYAVTAVGKIPLKIAQQVTAAVRLTP
ncbi:MucB/RseB C-terminal domain-containing protein [Aliidiomarina quisquiliarum]|uniref:MucB/RseB C-terminal domain-containing protein n=1 Tax=Aliidiomarina quisquiliarum TaxID=2938947 RepID=UPI00208E8761|nr:MucB/RseB C-terminal domain-containing protein [Aliidiomarina quisquiliarum]MCO4320577.1 MucB/RseB C-terminal domain-containing protein [Aliidiomarina quisquiliarum]